MVEVTCSYCGTSFTIHPSVLAIGSGQYCSRLCHSRAKKNIPLEPRYIPNSQKRTCICEHCGQMFQLPISKIVDGRGRYCSRECRIEAVSKKKIIALCQYCGIEFESNSRKRKYCSKKCFYAARREHSSTEHVCKHCGKKFASYAIRAGFHLTCLRTDQNNDIYRSTNLDMVNGIRVSEPQRKLCELLGGQLNYPCGSYYIDIALPDKKIAIEYDCWYWHGNRQDYDLERDNDLLVAGWKILHIKTNKLFPSQQMIEDAMAQLKKNKTKVEIVLDDWGIGEAFPLE